MTSFNINYEWLPKWKIDYVWVQGDTDLPTKNQEGLWASTLFQIHKSRDSPSSDLSGIFGPVGGAGASSTSVRVKCEVCCESWEKSKIEQHIGAHILQEHWK